MRAADAIRTRAARPTSLLGIERAIVGGPMAGVNTPELAAAVSNAGALGSIGCGMMEPERIEAAIARIRELTDKPFAVNLFITPQPQADEAQGRAEHISPWAGQAAGLATTEPAGDLVRRLQRELEALL